ncbi:hypothetical protein RHGRI_005767 [Rhododendron griersonianum]|uniref:NAA35-like N-terminal domain-containing protein n=1 Tax=Rhododendron griersonianum TaxID=479676 RepID=A0AAV6LDS4_9ERIC|nr:hypothetical protein RHGRI_005767 [Rhododendron griersonianum]
MDPKMDSGIVRRYYSEAIDSGVAAAAPVPLSSDRTIDVQCVIDIMDHLLACEATWHKGHSLAQTVFPCIYLLKLDRTLPHALLHSYCRVIGATYNSRAHKAPPSKRRVVEDIEPLQMNPDLEEEFCKALLCRIRFLSTSVGTFRHHQWQYQFNSHKPIAGKVVAWLYKCWSGREE